MPVQLCRRNTQVIVIMYFSESAIGLTACLMKCLAFLFLWDVFVLLLQKANMKFVLQACAAGPALRALRHRRGATGVTGAA